MEFGHSSALPTDPDERRRLWREWIHVDAPAAQRSVAPRRRASDRTVGSTDSAVRRVTPPTPAFDRPITPDGRQGPAEFPATGEWLHDVLGDRPAGVVEGLSAAIRESLVGTELPASDRERLLRRAVQLGLNRFEANLLIAAVQHRSRRAIGVPTLVVDSPMPRAIGVGKLVAWFIAIEALIAAGLTAWWLR